MTGGEGRGMFRCRECKTTTAQDRACSYCNSKGLEAVGHD